jgi:general secretion pathway protein D
MKTQHFKNIYGGALAVLLVATLTVHAQQRGGGFGGGGGGGFGGFGGFGGGGFGGGARSSSSSSSTYNNNGTVGSATITVDPQTHNLVVIADEETSLQISNVLANLDAPKPQVLIKVAFVEVQRNDGLDIGVEGAYNNSDLGNSLSGSAANVFGLAGANSIVTNFNGVTGAGTGALTPGAGGANGFYQIMGKDFQATLKAIATAGKSQVLSRPSILARDGQLAKIVIGQEVYLPSGVSQQATTGLTPVTTINGSYTEVGIILNVTPFIGANSLVEMIVQPQISSIDQTSSGQAIASGGVLGTTIFAPNLNIRSADTVVVTPDAQPVVIGGLISDTKSSGDSKVPILGDIPILGQLFKASTKSTSKTELLIFLTPHIVDSPSQLSGFGVGELHQAPAITNSVSEQDLDRFLERVPVKRK